MTPDQQFESTPSAFVGSLMMTESEVANNAIKHFQNGTVDVLGSLKVQASHIAQSMITSGHCRTL
jgi:hypothetical protein